MQVQEDKNIQKEVLLVMLGVLHDNDPSTRAARDAVHNLFKREFPTMDHLTRTEIADAYLSRALNTTVETAIWVLKHQ